MKYVHLRYLVRLILFLLFLGAYTDILSQNALNKDSLLGIWQSPSFPDSVRLDAGEELQRMFVVKGQLEALKAISDSMISTGRKNRNPEWEGLGCHGWGRYLEHTNKPKEATARFEEALRLFSVAHKPTRMALSHLSLSALSYRSGNTELALQLLDAGTSILDSSIHRKELCKIYQYRGAIAYNSGHYLQALKYNQLAEEHCGSVREFRVMASALLNIGNIFTVLEMPELARQNLTKAADILDSLQEIRSFALAQSALILASENLTEAKVCFEKGIQIAEDHNFQDLEMGLLLRYGKALIDSGQIEQAFLHLASCAKLAEELSSTSIYLNAQSSIADIYLRQGLPEKAIKLCQQILTHAENSKRQDLLQGIYGTLSASYGKTGRIDSAFHYLQLKMKLTEALQKDKNIAEVVRHFLTYQNEKEKEITQIKHKYALREKESILTRKTLFIWSLLILITILSSMIFLLYRFYVHRKKSAQHLEDINRQLESERSTLALQNTKLKRFTSIVSHDILSNLDLILSTGNVLVGSQPQTENMVRYYKMTQQTSRQLKQYCLNLLEEASKEQKTSIQMTDTMSVIQSVLARYSPALRETGVQIRVEDLSPTLLSAALTEQVFQNLISNALRYGADSAMPMLRIAEEQDPLGRTRWVVEDNGRSVKPEDRERIFQGTPGTSAQGNGLGLSLLRPVLREQGADIWVEERKGGGARFVVAMPQSINT
jgi:signal transduction histidine kinase